MPHLLLAGYEDVPSFLNQSKLKRSLILFILLHRLQEYCATYNSYSKTHIFRIIENTFSGNSCARKMFHLLLAGYEDVPSFLNQSKLKRSLILFILLHRLQEYSTTRNSYSKTHIFRIIENTLSGNSSARKMFHLLLAGYEDVPSFLNQSKLKRSLMLFILLHRLQEYSATCNSYSKTHIFRIIENTFSGNSCARKMFHLLLAGYEDVPSFLNQSKLKRSLILFILLHRLQEYSATCNSYRKTHIFRIIENTFSGNSCARKMSHLLLAGYEDVPSFLNQSKLKRSLILLNKILY